LQAKSRQQRTYALHRDGRSFRINQLTFASAGKIQISKSLTPRNSRAKSLFCPLLPRTMPELRVEGGGFQTAIEL
jgi:hypothetical protein